MSDYEVRPATLRDAKAVAEIHALSVKAAYEGILPEDELRALAPATREAKWREAIEYGEPQVHVVVQGSEIVGFVGFDRSRDPKTPPTTGESGTKKDTPAAAGAPPPSIRRTNSPDSTSAAISAIPAISQSTAGHIARSCQNPQRRVFRPSRSR